MSDTPRNQLDRELWRRLQATAMANDIPLLDSEMVAAYLGGGLDEETAAPIEAWLAADPQARTILFAATEAAGELAQPSAQAIQQAQSIVRGPVTVSRRRRWQLPDFLDLGWLRPLPALACAACAVIIVFFVSFELGSATRAAEEEVNDRLAAAIWFADLSRDEGENAS